MMTQREARQRLAINRMSFRHTDGEYRVSFAEMPYPGNEACAYYTDDLEDAVLTGARMRRNEGLIVAA